MSLNKLFLKGFNITLCFGLWTVFFVSKVHALTINTLNFYPEVISRDVELGIQHQNFPYPPEIVPSVVNLPNNAGRLYNMSTSYSFICKTTTAVSGNLLNSSPANKLTLASANCSLATQPDLILNVNSSGVVTPNLPNANYYLPDMSTPWRYTYNGITGLHLLGNRLVSIRHNEHQNMRSSFNNNFYFYQGTVFPQVRVDGSNPCYAGYVNGVWQQCWPSFAGFGSIGITNLSTYQPSEWNYSTTTDLGPHLWPEVAYKTASGTQSGWNIYHPTSFADSDYLYSFYTRYTGNGNACFTAARSPVNGSLAPSTWRVLKNGAFNSVSMPVGFTKEQIANYYDDGSPSSDCLFGDNTDQEWSGQWFRVARAHSEYETLPYYIGFEERYNPDQIPENQQWEAGVRISKDLIHWSPFMRLDYQTGGTWGIGKYTYPTAYNAESTSNDRVHIENAFMVGNSADNGASGEGYRLFRMQLKLHIKPPLDKIRTVVNHYYRQMLDRNGSSSDVDWWQNQFNTKGCRAIIKSFATSPEFQSRIISMTNGEYMTLLFRTILARDPYINETGYTYFLNLLNSGAFNRTTIVDRLSSAYEAYTACDAGLVYITSTPTPSRTPTPSPTPSPTPTPLPTNIIGDTHPVGFPDYDVDFLDWINTLDKFDQSYCAVNVVGVCLLDIFDHNVQVRNFGRRN